MFDNAEQIPDTYLLLSEINKVHLPWALWKVHFPSSLGPDFSVGGLYLRQQLATMSDANQVTLDCLCLVNDLSPITVSSLNLLHRQSTLADRSLAADHPLAKAYLGSLLPSPRSLPRPHPCFQVWLVYPSFRASPNSLAMSQLPLARSH